MRAPRRHCAYNRPFTREFRRRRRADARCRGDHRPARHPSSPGAAHDSRALARPRDSRDLATGANDALALVPRALPAIAACACVDARACAPGRDATARRENALARVATPSFAKPKRPNLQAPSSRSTRITISVANHTIDRTRDEHRFAKHKTDRPTVRFTNLQAPNPRAGSIRHQRTSRGSANLRSGDKNSIPNDARHRGSRNGCPIEKIRPRYHGCVGVRTSISIASMTGVSIVSSPRPRSRARARSRARLRLQGASRRVASRRAHAMALSLAQVAPAAQVRRVSHRRARRARLSASRTRARRRERRHRSASDRMAIGASSRVDARPGRDDARRRRRAREKSTTADARVTDERFRGAVFFA